MRRRSGLWAEIGLNLALLTVLVSVLDAGVLYLVTRSVLVDAAATVAESTAAALARELSTTPRAEWDRLLASHRRGTIGALTVYGPSGERLMGDNVPPSAAVSRVFISRERATEGVGFDTRVYAPVGPARPTAVLAISTSPEAGSVPLWTVIGLHALLSGGAVVVFGFFLFRRTVLGPVRQLQRGTAAIAAGAFDTRIPDAATAEFAEEFAALARALNGLAAALAGYRTRTDEQLRQLSAANAELRRAQEALLRSEKLASVGRLAAGLAHELGNPLTAVRAYMELLHGGVDDALSTELVGRSRTEVERMHELLRNLLDFARMERRGPAPVDLSSVAEDALRTVRHQPAFRDTALELHVEGAPVVQGEAPKLLQAVVNLLLNAGAAGARAVQVGAVERAGAVELSVHDDGSGIAPADLGRVLEPFFTTRPPGEGTGLGLAIVHRVAEEHGARVLVESAPGSGTTFRLVWPAPPGERVAA